LVVGKIVEIERHPEAEKLYIEKIDCGEAEPRTIVSGIVPYYTEEELLGKNVVVVANLKSAKLRGIKSMGMILAAEDNEKNVEVIFPENAEPGTPVVLAGDVRENREYKQLKAKRFFEIPLRAEDFVIKTGETALTIKGEDLKTSIIKNGEVG
jgi:methionyl-tRNA synthetase